MGWESLLDSGDTTVWFGEGEMNYYRQPFMGYLYHGRGFVRTREIFKPPGAFDDIDLPRTEHSRSVYLIKVSYQVL